MSRRFIRPALVIAIGATVCASALAVPAAAHVAATDHIPVAARAGAVRADWPQDGLTPLHQSDNQSESILTGRNLTLVRQAWSVSAGGNLLGAPTVAGGRLFVGAGDGHLHAVNARTGTPLWSSPLYLYVVGPPAVAGRTVYVGDHGAAVVEAHDVVTGALGWRTSTVGFVGSSPTVAGTTVYVGTGNGGQTHGLGYLYAFNRASGAIRWRFDLSPSASGSPVVANGVVYIGSANGYLYALDAATGRVRWSFNTGGDQYGMGAPAPMFANGTVYFAAESPPGSASETFYALNASTGAVRWSQSSSAPGRPAFARGVVYKTFADGLHAIAASSGHTLWVAHGPAGEPVIANGVVYMATPTGLRTVSAANGTPLRSGATGNVTSSLIVVNGTIYAENTSDSSVTAYTLRGVLPSA